MAESKPTPQSTFTGPIVVDPITRIEGHLRIMDRAQKAGIDDVGIGVLDRKSVV